MATVWLSYAWQDNTEKDVDFVAQEIKSEGVQVKLDRWNVGAGKRLWEQIADFITDPRQSDAWVLYATQTSLGSEACKEEFSYALGRALETRGASFPVIGLFPSSIDNSLIPPGIKNRLYLSTTDPDWKERLKAAAEGREPSIATPEISPYTVQIHTNPPGAPKAFSIEVRPRAGTWGPFICGIPAKEKEAVQPMIIRGPRGHVTMSGMILGGEEQTPDGEWWLLWAADEATPTLSYYVHVAALPSKLMFGVSGRSPQYIVPIPKG